MNNFSGVGRLTRDPELRYTPQGTGVANFTLAIDRPFKSESGEQQTDFIRCVAFGKRAETIANYVKKGHRFGITGRVQTGSYQDKDGKTIYTTDIAVNDFTFLESKNTQGGNAQQGNPFNADAPQVDLTGDDSLPF